jgi:hypothetical protein
VVFYRFKELLVLERIPTEAQPLANEPATCSSRPSHFREHSVCDDLALAAKRIDPSHGDEHGPRLLVAVVNESAPVHSTATSLPANPASLFFLVQIGCDFFHCHSETIVVRNQLQRRRQECYLQSMFPFCFRMGDHQSRHTTLLRS